MQRLGVSLVSMVAATGSVLATSPAIGQETLRVADAGDAVALEIASVDFERTDGPVVTLVGVAHIGDQVFYRNVQTLLEGYEIVLYESVMPAGARGAGGETDEERHESTQIAMGFAGSVLAAHERVEGRYPADLEGLRSFIVQRDKRVAGWLAEAVVDGWGRPLRYKSGLGGSAFTLRSLGADGFRGGTGADADIELTQHDELVPFDAGGDDGMQAELAAALGLEFQLDAIDYTGDNWQCSDMTMDELSRALRERGASMEFIQSSLAGTSLPAQIAKLLLRFMRFADALFGGAIADMVKVAMIEMLADEEMIERSMRQIDPAMATVLIEDRNQRVIDDLAALLEEQPDLESVAILYGAAHLPDLGERLTDQLEYTRTGEQWLRAIEVDLTQSAISREDLESMRRMMRLFGG